MTYIFVVLGVITRLLPHWPNFVPIGSIGIFASNRYGVLKASAIMLSIMIITDIFLGFSFASIFVYVGMLTYVFWGKLIRSGKWWGYVVSPIGGSLSFFVISNLGVWLGPWYTHDLAGFVKCFTLAIVFYKFTLFSDIIFTAAIFGTDALVRKYKKSNLQAQHKLNRKGILWHTR